MLELNHQTRIFSLNMFFYVFHASEHVRTCLLTPASLGRASGDRSRESEGESRSSHKQPGTVVEGKQLEELVIAKLEYGIPLLQVDEVPLKAPPLCLGSFGVFGHLEDGIPSWPCLA